MPTIRRRISRLLGVIAVRHNRASFWVTVEDRLLVNDGARRISHDEKKMEHQRAGQTSVHVRERLIDFAFCSSVKRQKTGD